MEKQDVQILTSSRNRKNSSSKKSSKEIQKGNYFCKLIKTRPDLDFPARQLQLTGKYDTILTVYLRKKETDKLKYYLLVDRYLFLILTLLHSLSGEKRKLIKFSPCCQGNKAEKKELKGCKNPGLLEMHCLTIVHLRKRGN